MVAAICLVGINAIFKWLLFSSCSTKLEHAGEFQTQRLNSSSQEAACPGQGTTAWSGVVGAIPPASPVGGAPPGAAVGVRDRRALVSSSCRLLRERRPGVAGELCGLSERVTQCLVLTALLGEAVNTSSSSIRV